MHRSFVPGFEPPYVVGRVGPVERPDIDLDTELLLEREPYPGMPLEVIFREDARGFTVHAFGPAAER